MDDSGHSDLPREQIEKVLEGIRARGHAQSVGQRVAGAVGFASLVFDSEYNVCGEVCVTIPEQRYQAGGFADSIVLSLGVACCRVTQAMVDARFPSSRPVLPHGEAPASGRPVAARRAR